MRYVVLYSQLEHQKISSLCGIKHPLIVESIWRSGTLGSFLYMLCCTYIALCRDVFKKALNLPRDTIMEYKSNNDALRDNSSFRNTDVFRWKKRRTYILLYMCLYIITSVDQSIFFFLFYCCLLFVLESCSMICLS